jgi:anti-sigma B factor antagonist
MYSGPSPPPPAVDQQPNPPPAPPNTTSIVNPPTDTMPSTQGGCLLRINVGPAEDGVIAIAVAGELDLATAPLIDDAFHRLNSAQPLHAHLDLSGVTFCDATGLNAFLAADRLLHATSGRLTLIRPSPQIRRLLTITKLDQILAID